MEPEDSLQELAFVPILSKIIPVHINLYYIFKIHFTIILPYWSSNWLL
jgi:hypothetical protein